MKTEPTNIDREAAKFFELAAGMRIFAAARWSRIIWDHGDDRGGVVCTEKQSASYDYRNAADTDDPATVGAMVAQLERHGAVSVVDRLHLLPQIGRAHV